MSVTRQAQTLYTDLVGSARLAADAHSYLRLTLDFLLSRVMRHVRVPLAGRIRRVRLRGGVSLFYRLDRSDIHAIHEIWIEETYRLTPGLQPSVIIDLGANIGLASLWLAKRYQATRVIAVEPSEANASLTWMNLSANGVSAEVLEAAVGSEDGTVLFDAGPGATCGRVVDYNAPDGSGQRVGAAQTAVRLMSMATILRLLPEDAVVDLVKLDIEGGEENLLSGDVSWLYRVKALIAELHPNLIDYPKVKKTILNSGLLCVQENAVHENTLELFIR